MTYHTQFNSSVFDEFPHRNFFGALTQMAKSQPTIEIEPGATVQVLNLTASRRYIAQNRGGFSLEFTFAADLAEAQTLSWQICGDGSNFAFKERGSRASLFVRSSYARRNARDS